MQLVGGTPNHSTNRNKHSELITVLKNLWYKHAIFQSNKMEQRAYFSSMCVYHRFVIFMFVYVLCHIRLVLFVSVLVFGVAAICCCCCYLLSTIPLLRFNQTWFFARPFCGNMCGSRNEISGWNQQFFNFPFWHHIQTYDMSTACPFLITCSFLSNDLQSALHYRPVRL